MPRTELQFEQVNDPTFASQTELNIVKDNQTGNFDNVLMNNYQLWLDQNDIKNIANDSNFTFYTPGPLDPYIQVDETTYKTFASFIFRGTDIWIPSSLIAVLSRTKSVGISYLRVYDYTNANIVVEVPVTDQNIHLQSALISSANLPAGQAIFELQAYNSAANAGSIQLRALGLYP